MSFLNWVLLGGVATFTAPLIIHLLNRSRFKVVEWGAMHLLDAALQVHSQRIQWQSWLLLLIRCLIPIVLALSLARPVLTSWRSAGGGGAKSLVLLIDNSLSMQALDAAGASRFEQAIQQAQEVLTQQSPSTELSIWTIGGLPQDALSGTTFDQRRVSNLLQDLRAGAGSVPVQAALAAGLKQVRSMQNVSREIIVVSDFQAHEWQAFSDPQRAAFKQQLLAESIPVHLTMLPLHHESSSANLSVVLETLEQPLVVVEQVFRITAQICNQGKQTIPEVPIVLQVAGREIASRRLAVPAGGVTQAVFDCQIETPGTHEISVRITDPTGWMGDNVSYQVVQVSTPLHVLVVDSQATAPELQRASGYISLALSPFRSSDSGKNLMLSQVVNTERLNQADISNSDVVVLADVPRLSDSIAAELAEFVLQGGGLFLFSSSSLDVNWYNSHWGRDTKWPLLPSEYAPLPKPASANTRISPDREAHAAFTRFHQLDGEHFASVEIQAFQRLKVPLNQATETDASAAPAQVLLRLDSGEPLLIARSFGKGNVVQMATAADTSGSNFPLRPIYVPMLQGLVQWLATGAEPLRNATTGESLSIMASTNTTSSVAQTAVANVATMTLPDRSTVELQLDGGGRADFGETAFPGIYEVEFGHEPRDDRTLVERFAVNAPVDESQLQFLSTDDLTALAEVTSGNVVASAQELLTLQRLRANGREVWRWFLLGLVALLFIELWWQQRIVRGPL